MDTVITINISTISYKWHFSASEQNNSESLLTKGSCVALVYSRVV